MPKAQMHRRAQTIRWGKCTHLCEKVKHLAKLTISRGARATLKLAGATLTWGFESSLKTELERTSEVREHSQLQASSILTCPRHECIGEHFARTTFC